MLNKFGVNSTRAEKRCPIKVGNSVRHEKEIVCACGKKYIKSCPNEDVCEITVMRCPNCGAELM